MIFQQCPICGRYMIPNMSETSGWYQCVCGYDTRSYVYTYTNHSSNFIYGEEKRMTRLIDVDVLLKDMREDPLFPLVEQYNVTGKIETQPIVDAVEVVRCKDCKYGKVEDEDFPWQYFCQYNGNDWNDEDHYCSYGKRRKE